MSPRISNPARRDLKFADLLREAVSEPGIISNAYRLFHSYSFGNALAAYCQCQARNIEPGPIASFQRWKELGRFVKKGEKAILLCMPITCKRVERSESGEVTEHGFTRFVWRPNWFVLAQTDGTGQPEPLATPEWNAERALITLHIERVPFAMSDGNCQGYASGRKVAVSPLAENPLKTMLHELAHVVLGHTTVSDCADTGELSHADREVEAEATAYLCGSVLGIQGLEKSRGYLQHYVNGRTIPERSAARIFKAADAILKAGRPS